MIITRETREFIYNLKFHDKQDLLDLMEIIQEVGLVGDSDYSFVCHNVRYTYG